ncbi:MAG: InlB B-repeat-containing protein, partial [Oscillospiraceae bacterium]|nr:InlB B-repeat-containing protein [Oscillospiraceae bacterium]
MKMTKRTKRLCALMLGVLMLAGLLPLRDYVGVNEALAANSADLGLRTINLAHYYGSPWVKHDQTNGSSTAQGSGANAIPATGASSNIMRILDGSPTTSWSVSGGNNHAFFGVDLGKDYPVSKIVFRANRSDRFAMTVRVGTSAAPALQQHTGHPTTGTAANQYLDLASVSGDASNNINIGGTGWNLNSSDWSESSNASFEISRSVPTSLRYFYFGMENGGSNPNPLQVYEIQVWGQDGELIGAPNPVQGTNLIPASTLSSTSTGSWAAASLPWNSGGNDDRRILGVDLGSVRKVRYVVIQTSGTGGNIMLASSAATALSASGTSGGTSGTAGTGYTQVSPHLYNNSPFGNGANAGMFIAVPPETQARYLRFQFTNGDVSVQNVWVYGQSEIVPVGTPTQYQIQYVHSGTPVGTSPIFNSFEGFTINYADVESSVKTHAAALGYIPTAAASTASVTLSGGTAPYILTIPVVPRATYYISYRLDAADPATEISFSGNPHEAELNSTVLAADVLNMLMLPGGFARDTTYTISNFVLNGTGPNFIGGNHYIPVKVVELTGSAVENLAARTRSGHRCWASGSWRNPDPGVTWDRPSNYGGAGTNPQDGVQLHTQCRNAHCQGALNGTWKNNTGSGGEGSAGGLPADQGAPVPNGYPEWQPAGRNQTLAIDLGADVNIGRVVLKTGWRNYDGNAASQRMAFTIQVGTDNGVTGTTHSNRFAGQWTAANANGTGVTGWETVVNKQYYDFNSSNNWTQTIDPISVGRPIRYVRVISHDATSGGTQNWLGDNGGNWDWNYGNAWLGQFEVYGEILYKATYTIQYRLPDGTVVLSQPFNDDKFIGDAITMSEITSKVSVPANYIQDGAVSHTCPVGACTGASHTLTQYSSDNIFVVPVIPVPKYTVTYHGEGTGVTGLPSNATNITSGSSYTIPSTTPSRAGFSFQGWATSSGSAVVYASGSSHSITVTSDVNLYAVWVPVLPADHTITYNANGGALGTVPATVTVTDGGSHTVLGPLADTPTHAFGGWTASGALSGTYNASAVISPVSGDITLTAIWNAIVPGVFTITFRISDGHGDVYSFPVTSQTKLAGE